MGLDNNHGLKDYIIAIVKEGGGHENLSVNGVIILFGLRLMLSKLYIAIIPIGIIKNLSSFKVVVHKLNLGDNLNVPKINILVK